MAQSQLTSRRAPTATAEGLQSRAHRCLPRFSRVLRCSQHVYSELHSSAAPSLDAHSLRDVLKSVACDGSIATDIGGRQVQAAAGMQSHTHRCLPRFSRALSCSQHVYSELHSTAAPSLDAHSLSEALTSAACEGTDGSCQSQLINGGAACHSRNWLAGTRSPLPPTLQPRVQQHPAHPS